MTPIVWSAGLATVVWLGTLLGLEAGFRWGRREAERNAGRSHEGIGAVEASSFALLGLLLAFSFAGGTSRLEAKRQLVVAEANAIGTAYSRVDMLPGERQPAIRQQYKEKLDARLRAYDDRRSHEMEDADLQAMMRGIASDVSPVAPEDQIFDRVDFIAWTVGMSGRVGKLYYAAGVNYRGGNSTNIVVRNVLSDPPIQTSIDIKTIGMIYSLAYQF